MPQKTEFVSILFADISGSAKLYELLGDHVAQEIIGKILERLSDLTFQYSGKVIKTVGDAIVSTFNSTDNSIDAAKAMQLTMTCGISDDANLPQINIHIGIHHGSVVFNNNDIFGDAVNITARVADYANPRQIVVTRAVIDNLSAEAFYLKKYLTRITAKNISGDIELFEINFEEQQSTLVLDSRKISEELFCSSLYLTRGGQVIVLDLQKQVVSIGREDFNDIVIKYSWISRTHAYIENRNGIFMLNDKSTNGTYIYPQNSNPMHINKREHQLLGKGIIIFGREMKKDVDRKLDDVIEYTVK